MSKYDLEYAIAVFQKGIFTFAAKEHRRQNGKPTLTIDVTPTQVVWTVSPLSQGIPDTNDQQPQKDRFDLYFLLKEICGVAKTWPTTGASPAIWQTSVSNEGTERVGGKTIKMATPVGRITGISKLTAQVGMASQPFTASALNLNLFADVEHTPKGKLYPAEEFQFHIGFQGNYQYTGGVSAQANQVTIEMTHAIYEAIRSKLIALCR